MHSALERFITPHEDLVARREVLEIHRADNLDLLERSRRAGIDVELAEDYVSNVEDALAEIDALIEIEGAA